MKTIVFKLKIDQESSDKIKHLQEGYCIDFRKLYNNLDLQKDESFLNSLRTKSTKMREFLIKEVVAFKEKYDSGKERLLENIQKLEKQPLTKKVFKKLTKLKKSYKSKICFGGRENLKRRTKKLITNEEFHELRLYPMVFYGETASKGNRFFDFKDLSNGNVLFKISKEINIPLHFSNKKHTEELRLLQDMCLNKQISLSIKLTYN